MSKKNTVKSSGNKELILVFALVLGIGLFAFLLIWVGQTVSSKRNQPSVPTNQTAEYEADGYYNRQEVYSKGIDSDGRLTGITAGDYVSLCDMTSIKVPEMRIPSEYISDYLLEHCEVKECAQEINRRNDVHLFSCNEEYEYVKKNADSAYADSNYSKDLSSVWAYYACKTEDEFKERVLDLAKKDTAKYLIYQAIMEKEGLSVSDEDVSSWLSEMGLKSEDLGRVLYKFGENYVNHMAMEQTIVRFIQKQ